MVLAEQEPAPIANATSSAPSLPFPRPNPLQPAGELGRLRAAAPVSRVIATSGEPAWLVTRYDEARAVLADRRFGLALPGLETGGDEPNDSLFQDPPGHTRLRRLVSAAFTPRRVAELRPRIAEVAAGLVEEMMTPRPPVDLMEAVGFPLPITVIGELLGVPTAERENFRAWSNALLSLPSSGGTDPGTGWAQLSAQVSDLIGRKRADPGDDLLSGLIAVRDTDADHLSEAELVMMAITLIPAGYVTTSIGAGVGTILLTAHNQLRRLTQDPGLVPGAVEEVLRYQAVAGDVARVATENVQLAGLEISAGDKVLVSLTAANRDGRRFTDPDCFDIARPDNAHLTFGHGIHHCLGAALARLELQVLVATLAARLPNLHLAVAAEELVWQRSELFGDEWLQTIPVSW